MSLARRRCENNRAARYAGQRARLMIDTLVNGETSDNYDNFRAAAIFCMGADRERVAQLPVRIGAERGCQSFGSRAGVRYEPLNESL